MSAFGVVRTSGWARGMFAADNQPGWKQSILLFASASRYSYRKLGDYGLSQVWYERALRADPNHMLMWQYYGLWQIER